MSRSSRVDDRAACDELAREIVMLRDLPNAVRLCIKWKQLVDCRSSGQRNSWRRMRESGAAALRGPRHRLQHALTPDRPSLEDPCV